MWSTSTLRWINLGDDNGGPWVRVDQIEAVWRAADRRVTIRAISGETYKAPTGKTMKHVLDLMAKEEDQ